MSANSPVRAARRFAVLAAISGVSLFPAVLRGEDVTPKQAVGELLRIGWSSSLDARAATDDWLEKLPESVGQDVRVRYALLLVQMKQTRYAAATETATELAARKEAPLEVLRAKTWLAMLQRKPAAGVVDLEKLAARIAGDKDDPREAERNADLVRFVGRMYGYLDGPAQAALPAAQREASRKKALEPLTAKQRILFEEAASDVVAQSKSLLSEKDSAKEKAVAKAQADKEKMLADLEKQESKMASRRDELQARRQRIADEMRSELTDLERSDRPLAEMHDSLRLQARSAGQDYAILQADLGRLQVEFARERDPLRREIFAREIDRVQAALFRAAAVLDNLDRQADRVAAQRTELQRKAASVRNRYGGQLNDLERELSDMEKAQKKIDAQRAQARRSETVEAPQVAALLSKATAFTTYDVFPLEAEKQRLLDSIHP